MIGLKLIDIVRRTSIVSEYNQLADLQKQSQALVIELQRKKLVTFLSSLKEHNKLYKLLLSKVSYREIQTDPVEILLSLPLVEKQLMEQDRADLFSPIPGRKFIKKRTGGSSGVPFQYYLDLPALSRSWAFIYSCWHRYSAYAPGDPFLTIAGNSLHAQRSFENIYHLLQNNYFVPGDVIDHGMKISRSKVSKAKLIYGYPSSIVKILDQFPELPRQFNRLSAVFTTSELLLPNFRSRIEREFGVEVFDMYGANDGGVVSCECREHNGYHYDMLNCYVESHLNEDGQNELLLTSLNNYTFPFVRYRIGDLGTLDHSECECRFPSVRIQNLMGRTRDLLFIEGRGYIHGSFFNSIMYGYPEVKMYKVVQEKDHTILIYVLTNEEKEFQNVGVKLLGAFNSYFPGARFSIRKMAGLPATADKFKVIESYVD